MSYSKNFIFIKTQKTGSSSVEILLSSLCDKFDYFAPITDYLDITDDETIRKNFTSLLPKTHFKSTPIYDHMSAKDIRQLDDVFFENAFKFCIERHPYEKVISAANHKIYRFGISPMEYVDVVNHIIMTNGFSDKKLYTEREQLIVDKVIQYSEMNNFIENFYYKLTNKKVKLPNSKQFKKEIDINFLTKDQKAQIYTTCKFEFDLFNYDPMLDISISY